MLLVENVAGACEVAHREAIRCRLANMDKAGLMSRKDVGRANGRPAPIPSSPDCRRIDFRKGSHWLPISDLRNCYISSIHFRTERG